jgi:hypothetical protein
MNKSFMGYFDQDWVILFQVSFRSSGSTRVSPVVDMKLVSPPQRGTM